MITVKVGDMFDSKMKTLVNTVNTVGVMGKGVALEFKKRFPDMYKEYVALCESKQLKVGEPYLYYDLTGASILVFPTKEHWRSPSKLSYIIDGLDWFVQHYDKLGIESIAFPPLGCGNGGLEWDDVGPLMYEKLKALPIDIEMYAPYGTSPSKLKQEYLVKNKQEWDHSIQGSKNSKIREEWYLIILAAQLINHNQYTLKVGRTIFQKICYALTVSGVETGMEFTKGAYGPYSADVQKAMSAFSNANLTIEKQIGQMIEVSISDTFKIDLEKYSQRELVAVKKTVDLFSRVKNTDQAELMSTIIYSYYEVSKQVKRKTVPANDIYKYIVEWKKRWKGVRDEEIYSNIINLAIFEWINVSLSSKQLERVEEMSLVQ